MHAREYGDECDLRICVATVVQRIEETEEGFEGESFGRGKVHVRWVEKGRNESHGVTRTANREKRD